jgi:hypothetical protein
MFTSTLAMPNRHSFMKQFTRLSLVLSKKPENLAAAVALHVVYFNCCWRSRENTGGRQWMTPAMQAGIASELLGHAAAVR